MNTRPSEETGKINNVSGVTKFTNETNNKSTGKTY